MIIKRYMEHHNAALTNACLYIYLPPQMHALTSTCPPPTLECMVSQIHASQMHALTNACVQRNISDVQKMGNVT